MKSLPEREFIWTYSWEKTVREELSKTNIPAYLAVDSISWSVSEVNPVGDMVAY
jgi:hypothetical protein